MLETIEARSWLQSTDIIVDAAAVAVSDVGWSRTVAYAATPHFDVPIDQVLPLPGDLGERLDAVLSRPPEGHLAGRYSWLSRCALSPRSLRCRARREVESAMELLDSDPQFAEHGGNQGFFSAGEKKRYAILQPALLKPKTVFGDETGSGPDVDALRHIRPEFVQVCVGARIVEVRRPRAGRRARRTRLRAFHQQSASMGA